MSFPIIDMSLLDGAERPAAMGLLRDACESWGFFEVENCAIEY